MIEFKFSSNLTEDFIVDVNNLDHSLYPPNYVGSVESIKERFTANNEEYILAYNNDTLVGYICFYPITKVLADKIKCLNKVIDDEISKKDILKYDDRLKNITILLMSIVVSKNYQNKGIGSSLISKMMSYLELKIQTGIDISEILAETVSEDGEKIVSKFGFKKRGGFNNKAKLYSYSFKAYENGDLFLFAPCYLKNTIEKQQINSEFLSFLNNVTKNEFTSMPIKKEINRNFIGTFEFTVHEDYDIYINHFNIFGDLYLTTIHGFASIFIYFHNIQNDICYLLDNASTGSLLIKINNDTYMFDEYLSTIGIVLTGRYRSFNVFNSMPTESYLTHILAMEQYKTTDNIVSKELITQVHYNIANYDFSKIIASENSIVYILKDGIKAEENALNYEALLIFILEQIMLKISFLSNNIKLLTSKIEGGKFRKDIYKDIYESYAHSLILSDFNKYAYPLAKDLAIKIYKIFNIEALEKEYENTLNIYSQMLNYESEKTSGSYFKIFTLLSTVETISLIVTLIFELFLDSSQLKSIVTLVLLIICISIFILIQYFNFIFHFKKKK